MTIYNYTKGNGRTINIPDSGASRPYPSGIIVSGVSGFISNVSVELRGVNHTYSDDLDVLLVGPNNQKVLLMSDAGGSNDLNNAYLTFDQNVRSRLSDSGQIVSGTYRPTNYGGGDTFNTPAPGGPYGTNLGVFNGADPNGNWKLYVMDDAGGDSGYITQGWRLSIETTTPPINTYTKGNGRRINIPDSGASNPYPSGIIVSGVSGTISNVSVKLRGVNHTYSDDLDVLLVGPTGAKALLMSDAGGSNDLNNAQLTFDQSAVSVLPNSGPIASGTYRPKNYGGGDIFNAPAPIGPYGSDLGVFNGTNPNGGWKLFVMDDAGGDSGYITQGWQLTIQTV